MYKLIVKLLSWGLIVQINYMGVKFSHEQAQAAVWSMVSVVMADHKVTPKEQQLLMKIISDELNETVSILVESKALTQDYVVPILRKLSNEQKSQIVAFWDKLMLADSEISPRVVHLVVAMGTAIDADVSAYRYLLGLPISVIHTLQGTEWLNKDGSMRIKFDSNSENGCLYNGCFGIYHYDRLNDLIKISVDDCGLCVNHILVISAQTQNTMTVVINGKPFVLIKK